MFPAIFNRKNAKQLSFLSMVSLAHAMIPQFRLKVAGGNVIQQLKILEACAHYLPSPTLRGGTAVLITAVSTT